MKELHLKKGTALISDRDWCRVKNYNWCINGGGYVIGRVDGKRVYLHRFIMSAPSSLKVDHKNCVRTDNRRCNLRFATQRENLENSRLSQRNTSGYKGVCWNKDRQKWQVMLTVNYKNIWGGYFDDKIEAAKMYNKMARKYCGRFARLNEVKI